MLRNPRWSLEELACWAQWGHVSERLHNLLRPHDLVWPKDPTSLELSCQAVLNACGEHLTLQALAASVLGQQSSFPVWIAEWCANRIDLHTLGLPFDWEAARSLSWSTAAVALAQCGSGRLCRFLIGLLPPGGSFPSFPHWWVDVADSEARRAVDETLKNLERLERVRVFIWPLLVSRNTVQICGSSMTLPLYLSAWGLKRGLSPPSILASGILDGDYSLHPVAYLEEKLSLAATEGFHAFLTSRPASSLTTSPEGVELLPVADLTEAQLVWECYAPGDGSRLLHQTRSVGEADWLAANAHLLRGDILKQPTIQDRYVHTLDSILDRKELIKTLRSNLETLADVPGARLDALKDQLGLLDISRVRELADRFPLEAFRLAQLQVTCANHRGSTDRINEWLELSRQLESSLGPYEEEIHLRADRINRQFIAERHNRYDFRPEIPKEMQEVMIDLQTLHSMKKRKRPDAVCESLARLYGTLAQNFGFCGPGSLPSMVEMAANAQETFGGGGVQEYWDDWARQCCYLVYAYLDAGRYDKAAEALTTYLGVPPQEIEAHQLEALRDHQHAVLARYLSQTNSRAPSYLNWALSRCHPPCRTHPRQLWLLNLGDLAQDREDKLRLWSESTDCCLHQESTVQIMALLPLSRIWSAGLAGDEWTEKRTTLVMDVLKRSRTLRREHFLALLEAEDWREALRTVAQDPVLLFPFSYR